MYIGYNVLKINEVMKDIVASYLEITRYINSSWLDLRTELRTQWVGPDEQDFEKNFIKRLNDLINSSEQLARNSVDIMYELAVAWADFQDKNTISGESTGEGMRIKARLNKPNVIKPTLVEFN